MSIREKCLAAALGRQGRHDLSWANGLDTLQRRREKALLAALTRLVQQNTNVTPVRRNTATQLFYTKLILAAW